MHSIVSPTRSITLACFIAVLASACGGGGGGDSSTPANQPQTNTPTNQPQNPAAPAPTQGAPLTPPDRTLGAPTPLVSDVDILEQVTANLAAEELLVHSEIRATATDGVVTLEGTVSDTDALLAAERAVGSVSGVSSVDNNLVPLACTIQTSS